MRFLNHRCGCYKNRAIWLGALVALLLMCGAHAASAGGGPENLLLVVNADDIGSKTIANYYVQLRQIPPGNVVYLDPKTWGGSTARLDIDSFRDKILKPVIEAVGARSLVTQIDYV